MDPHGDITDTFGGSRKDEPREQPRRPAQGTPEELFDVEVEGAEDAMLASEEDERPARRAPNADLDLLDAIVDDELTRSIEAGADGPWNDTGTFTDPKLKELEKELQEKPLRPRSYRKRRFDEVLEKAENDDREPKRPPGAKPRRAPAAQGTAGPAARQAPEPPTRRARRHTSVEPEAWTEVGQDATSATEPVAHDDPANLHVRGRELDEVESAIAAVQASLVLAYTPSLFAATLVFVATTMVHGLMLGWHVDLVSRAVVAMLVTGVLWKRFQGGRGRAMAFGATVYIAAFTPWTDMNAQETVIAMFLGLLTVVAGSGLIGVQDDEFGSGL